MHNRPAKDKAEGGNLECNETNVALSAFALSTVSALLGAFINHRLTASRDTVTRRRELARALHEAWFKELQYMSPLAPGASALQVSQYGRTLWFFQRGHFHRCVAEYQAAKQHTTHDELGQQSYSRPEAVRDQLERLLKLTQD